VVHVAGTDDHDVYMHESTLRGKTPRNMHTNDLWVVVSQAAPQGCKFHQ
jgi:hypothetical protein